MRYAPGWEAILAPPFSVKDMLQMHCGSDTFAEARDLMK